MVAFSSYFSQTKFPRNQETCYDSKRNIKCDQMYGFILMLNYNLKDVKNNQTHLSGNSKESVGKLCYLKYC